MTSSLDLGRFARLETVFLPVPIFDATLVELARSASPAGHRHVSPVCHVVQLLLLLLLAHLSLSLEMTLAQLAESFHFAPCFQVGASLLLHLPTRRFEALAEASIPNPQSIRVLRPRDKLGDREGSLRQRVSFESQPSHALAQIAFALLAGDSLETSGAFQ
jgi:hypothetical protein